VSILDTSLPSFVFRLNCTLRCWWCREVSVSWISWTDVFCCDIFLI